MVGELNPNRYGLNLDTRKNGKEVIENRHEGIVNRHKMIEIGMYR